MLGDIKSHESQDQWEQYISKIEYKTTDMNRDPHHMGIKIYNRNNPGYISGNHNEITFCNNIQLQNK